MKEKHDEFDEHRFSDDGNPNVPDDGDPMDCPPNCGDDDDNEEVHVTDPDVLDDLTHKNVRETSASGDLESAIREAASEAPDDAQAGKEMSQSEYTGLLATRAAAARAERDKTVKRTRLRNDRRRHGETKLYTGRQLKKRNARRRTAAKSRAVQRDHSRHRPSKTARIRTGGKARGRR